MISSRPKKCRYTIQAYTVSLRALLGISGGKTKTLLLYVVYADMSLKEALQYLVSLAKEKKKEEQRDHGKIVDSMGTL